MMYLNLSTIPTTKKAITELANSFVAQKGGEETEEHEVILGNGLTGIWSIFENYLNVNKSVTGVLLKSHTSADNEFRFSLLDLYIFEQLMENDLPDINSLPEDHPFLLIEKIKAAKEREKTQGKDPAIPELNKKFAEFMSKLLEEIYKKDPHNITFVSKIDKLNLGGVLTLFSDLLRSEHPLDSSVSVVDLSEIFVKKFKEFAGTKKEFVEKQIPLFTESMVFLATAGEGHFNLSADFVAILKNNVSFFAHKEGIDAIIDIMRSPRLSGMAKSDILVSMFTNKHFVNFFAKSQKMDNVEKMLQALIAEIVNPKDKNNTIDWLTMCEFVAALSKNKKLPDNVKAFAVNHVKNMFQMNTEVGINLLTPSKFKTLIEENGDQAFLSEIMKSISKYLKDSKKPLESKARLFCSTFETFCEMKLQDKELFIPYLKFIKENLKERPIKDTLKMSIVNFLSRFPSLESFKFSSALVDEKLVDELLKDFTSRSSMGEGGKIYEKIVEMVLLMDLKHDFSKDPDKKIEAILPTLHKNRLNDFSEMILPEPTKKEFPYVSPFVESKHHEKVIYNLQGYDKGINIPSKVNYQIGKPLALKDTPIGYNVHLPKGKPKGIVVKVYGGSSADERVEALYRPNDLNNLQKELLTKGYAVATLNLADLLKLKDFQGEMPEELHHTIHESINHFYDTIKNQPENLDPMLAALKGVPAHLFGSSFGGRTAVRHAELYPHTFDSYISFDGALSVEMLKKSDSKRVKDRFGSAKAEQAKAWIDPALHINNISKPVLLCHNVDDNNVNVEVSLDFMEKIKKAGKQDLMRIYIAEKGSPVNKKNLTDSGHHLPKSGEGLKELVETVSTFLEKGAPALPALHDWRTLKHDTLAKKNYREATLEQKFVSEAYRLHQTKDPNNEEAWKARCASLYYTLNYLDTLKDNPDQCMKETKKLKDTGLLTKKVIARSLEGYLGAFLNFVKEAEGIKMPSNLDMHELANNSQLQNEYMRSLRNDKNTMHYLISTLYKANPELLQSQFEKYEKDPLIQSKWQEAYNNLNDKIEKEEKVITNVWQQAIQKMREQKKKEATQEGKKLLYKIDPNKENIVTPLEKTDQSEAEKDVGVDVNKSKKHKK